MLSHLQRDNPQSLHYYQGYIFCGTGVRNRGYALLVKANKPQTALNRAPTFSLLLASHGVVYVHVPSNFRNMSNLKIVLYKSKFPKMRDNLEIVQQSRAIT